MRSPLVSYRDEGSRVRSGAAGFGALDCRVCTWRFRVPIISYNPIRSDPLRSPLGSLRGL